VADNYIGLCRRGNDEETSMGMNCDEILRKVKICSVVDNFTLNILVRCISLMLILNN
jgi:hypothetical protein